MAIARRAGVYLKPEPAGHVDGGADFDRRLVWYAEPFLAGRGFSATERALAMGILSERTNKEIAAGQKLTENTVESYLKAPGGHLGRCPRRKLHRDFLTYLFDRLDVHQPR
jgi:hypothetical protein